MQLRNYTPFPPLVFESRDEHQRDFGVLILRGTCKLENKKTLVLEQEQEPLLFKDEYYDEPHTSSLRFESSLAPYKPKTDVIINASAYSPSGQPQKIWAAGVQFGDVKKVVTVTGERSWEKRDGSWSPTPVKPVDVVPLTYELAYGGAYAKDGVSHKHDENPVGRGFVDLSLEKPVPIPQIYNSRADAQKIKFGESVEVAGLGAVAPHWAPRSSWVGTYNEMWKKTRFPDLPSDFDFRFYNTASNGLTLDSIATGDEVVELVNLSEEHALKFQLPAIALGTLMRFESGELLPGPVLLDTVTIDVEERKVYLTWRAVYPANDAIRVLEVRATEMNTKSSALGTQAFFIE